MHTMQLGSVLISAGLVIASAGCAATSHGAAPAYESGSAPALNAHPAMADPAPGAPEAAAPEAALPEHAATSTEPAISAAPASAPAAALEEGSWRIAGGSSALLETSDLGQGDQTDIGLGVTGGWMLNSNLMIEGLFDYSYSKLESNNGADLTSSAFDLGVGARYYFLIDGSTKPYARAGVGLTFTDVDLGQTNDNDTAPFIGLGAGAETFFTDHFSLEYGVRLQQAFDLFNEDVTSIGLFVGLAIWF